MLSKKVCIDIIRKNAHSPNCKAMDLILKYIIVAPAAAALAADNKRIKNVSHGVWVFGSFI
jgi:hypothetical protein